MNNLGSNVTLKIMEIAEFLITTKNQNVCNAVKKIGMLTIVT